MATLDQMLSRLPRKTPDDDFVDKLFQRIRRDEVLASVTVINQLNQSQFEMWKVEQGLPFVQFRVGQAVPDASR